MKRILITGHTGMLGQRIVQRFQQVDDVTLFGVSKTNRLGVATVKEYQVDLSELPAVSNVLSEINPDVIIHTAAFTNLNYCESHKKETYQLHVELSKLLGEYKAAKIIYISTDSVFNGEGSSYSENDPTDPLNYYAQSKLEGERAIRMANPDSLILRTNIYGFKNQGSNSLAEWGLKSFREGKQINGYSDIIFNPLYVGQLADLIAKLMLSDLKGILHVGTSENISKFDFLTALAMLFGFPETLVLKSPSPKDDAIRRPKNTSLSIAYLKEVLNENPSVLSGLNMFKSDYRRAYEAN